MWRFSPIGSSIRSSSEYRRVLSRLALSEVPEQKLQELVQQEGEVSIQYEEVSESGPDHNKTFTFRVVINGSPAGEGSGRTKKEAEQAAAGMALERLRP